MLDGYISDLEAGDVLRTIEYDLTELIVSEYAHGVEEDAEYYHSDENPFGRQVRVPSSAHIDRMRVLEESCTKERRIAGDNAPDWRILASFETESFSAAFAGERLRCSGRVVDVYEKRGRRYVQFEFRTETVDGRLISIQRDHTLLRYEPAVQERKALS